MQINEQIKKEIRNALDFLEKNNIPVPEPSFVFTGEFCDYNACLLASINHNLHKLFGEKDRELLIDTFGEQDFQRLENALSVIKIPELEHEEDIIFYKPSDAIFLNHMDNAKSLVFEEIWHYAEAVKKVDYGLISEGTATHAAWLYSRIETTENLMACDCLVKDAIVQYSNPFQAMLESDVRKRIETAFLRERIKGVDRLIEVVSDHLIRK